jgi:hypothetical protein
MSICKALPRVLAWGMLLATVLFSASCGCSSGSTAPPTPDTGYNPPPQDGHYWDHHNYGNHDGYQSYDGYYNYSGAYRHGSHHHDYLDEGRDLSASNQKLRESPWFGHELLAERWLSAASVMPWMQFNLVELPDPADLNQLGRLIYRPQYGLNEQGVDPATAAYAFYCFQSAELRDSAPVYAELSWYLEPLKPTDVWVGVYQHDATKGYWIWRQAAGDMRIPLLPFADCRSADEARSVYIAVLVTGQLPAVLESLSLRQYRN